MRAILSDIHANLEALTAVLADIERQGIRSVYNLGDTLGYGPDPIACLDHTIRLDLTLLGNHDQAVLVHPDGFCQSAENCILWHRAILERTEGPLPTGPHGKFLASLPRSHRENGVRYVHGSPRSPLYEYVFPEDIDNPRKLERIGSMFETLCFCGHTHVPGLFVHVADERWEYVYAEECEKGFDVTGRKVLCNVGSVGQPRDDDERACYATFDGRRIRFHRVEYDFETTIKKVYAIPEIANFLGDRLREGR
ncbi:metallophosphoesterase family protein [bacterium]|nr:metallophosphoesterase family protein [bacterium]